jgi:hypothetical protein
VLASPYCGLNCSESQRDPVWVDGPMLSLDLPPTLLASADKVIE